MTCCPLMTQLLTHSSENLTHWVLRMLKAETGFPQWLPRPDPRKSCSQANRRRSVREAQLLPRPPCDTKDFYKGSSEDEPRFPVSGLPGGGHLPKSADYHNLPGGPVAKTLSSQCGGAVLGMGALVQPLAGELRFLHASGCDQNK